MTKIQTVEFANLVEKKIKKKIKLLAGLAFTGGCC